MLILVYIFDSLRRDFLGCYGDHGALTPHLDRFAGQATRFSQGYAPAPWSKPSATGLLTGYLPRSIGVRQLLDHVPAGVPTLAERLGAAGVPSVAVSANPFVSDDFGLLRGFDRTVEAFRPGALPEEHFYFHADHFRRLADSLTVDPTSLVLARSEALHRTLLEALPAQGPAFALCWSMDTHAPFFVRGEQSHFSNPLDRVIPAADPEWLVDGLTVADLTSLYRDMIAYNDARFGALVRELQARGRWDDALVIVAGDHGEAFGEHDLMGHTGGLWEEQVAVPLLVKFPGQQEGTGCERPVSLLDVVPTVEEATGLPPVDTGDALSLQRVLAGEGEDRALYMESPDGWALRAGAWKALAPADDRPPHLFNLRTDPRETRPLHEEQLRADLAARAAAIQRAADEQAGRWAEPAEPELEKELLERLEQLGYL